MLDRCMYRLDDEIIIIFIIIDFWTLQFTAAGVLGDNGEHIAHAQTHVASGDDFSSGKELVLARRLGVVEEGVLVQQHKANTSHVSLKSV